MAAGTLSKTMMNQGKRMKVLHFEFIEMKVGVVPTVKYMLCNSF